MVSEKGGAPAHFGVVTCPSSDAPCDNMSTCICLIFNASCSERTTGLNVSTEEQRMASGYTGERNTVICKCIYTKKNQVVFEGKDATNLPETAFSFL